MKLFSLILMMRYWFVFSAFFILLFLSSSIEAVEVKDLYIAKVSVESQGTADRNKALKQALQSVLVKVGGQQSILSHQAIKPHLRRYNSFVTNYTYQRTDTQQFLQATFDQAKINQLFVDANLPIWGSLRPQVVLWLVNEQGLTRQLIAETSQSELVQSVKDFTNLRGLPIVLPLFDIADTSTISSSDVWGRFSQPIFHASKRYLAEAIIIVRVSDNSLLSGEQLALTQGCQLLCQQAITVDWSFISADNEDEPQQFSESYQGFDRADLLTQALSDITDNIYQRYALTTDVNNQYEIDVANVETLATYVSVTQFLQQLSSVQSVRLVSADGSSRRFSLTLIGSERTLLASLKLNKALKQHIDVLDPSLNTKVPVFYWEKL